MTADEFEYVGENFATKGVNVPLGSDAEILLEDGTEENGSTIEVSFPSGALESSCVGYEGTEKQIQTILYKEPSKDLTNSNNTITDSSD